MFKMQHFFSGTNVYGFGSGSLNPPSPLNKKIIMNSARGRVKDKISFQCKGGKECKERRLT